MEVWGLSLGKQGGRVERSIAAEIRTLLRKHGVLVFRKQGDLDAAALENIMQALFEAGDPGNQLKTMRKNKSGDDYPVHPSLEGLSNAPKVHIPGHPSVRALGNSVDREGKSNALFCRTGLEWHSDGLDYGTLLYCESTPGNDDTLFAWSHDLWNRLDHDSKVMAENAILVYSNRFTGGGPSAYDCEFGLRMNETGTRLLASSKTRRKQWRLAERRVPFIRVHPETRKKGITIDIRHFERIEGWSIERSRDAMEKWLGIALGVSHMKRNSTLDPKTMLAQDDGGDWDEEIVYRHKWANGDVVLFDNDAVIHTPSPTAMYEGLDTKRRILQIISKLR